jgi:CDP-diacylglycerol--serine O-phosphatidyltransferase
LFLWSLNEAPRFGWTVALALAVCCALRLARYNSRIDVAEQPHKSAGFNTGVPAPAGAGLAFVPIYLNFVTGSAWFVQWQVVMPWTLFIAALMISNVPTFGWNSLRIRRSARLFVLAAIAMLGAALASEPWWTLLAISAVYLACLPAAWLGYARVRRRRAAGGEPSRAG